ncbi:MAG: LysR family transcriptional regulator [Rhodobiaceae bacterium]|nr:LysR family transcriptional regulator [Rhodobiaceae bacterium]
MPDLMDMEVFSRVVTSGSMSAAARELTLSPAVVSKRIQRLESALGCRLLQRTTRKIALTEAGEGYYERVVAILASVEEANDFVARRNVTAQGTLKVSAPTSFGRMHLAPHLTRFLAAHPHLRLNLDLDDAFVDLVGGGYDVAVRIGELEDSSLVARRLCANRRYICAAPSYLDQHGVPKTLGDLSRHACITPTTQDTWYLEGPDGAVDLRISSTLQTNSSEVVREAVISGMGIALRSTWDIGEELKTGRLVALLPQYRTSRRIAIHAVYPSRRFLPAKVRAFVDFLSGLFGPEPYWDAGLDPVGPAGYGAKIG